MAAAGNLRGSVPVPVEADGGVAAAAAAAAEEVHDVVIVGSGPAAHTAAIYTARAGLRPVLYEGMVSLDLTPGGQLTTTTVVENYPGFPRGVGGLELVELLTAQSKQFGTRVVGETIGRVDFTARPLTLWPAGDGAAPVRARAVIIATGATPRKLDVPGSSTYWQAGISTCATCDGAAPRFRRQVVLVVGGGDTACEEALHLARTASRVVLVHRRDALRASKIMVGRVLATPNISVAWDSVVEEVVGDAAGGMSGARLRNVKTGATETVAARGLFYAIGHIPTTAFLGGALALDAEGYIVTTPAMATSVPGVFAAGDVQDRHYRQAITAAGSGCVAALEAERWLALGGGGAEGGVPVPAPAPVTGGEAKM